MMEKMCDNCKWGPLTKCRMNICGTGEDSKWEPMLNWQLCQRASFRDLMRLITTVMGQNEELVKDWLTAPIDEQLWNKIHPPSGE